MKNDDVLHALQKRHRRSLWLPVLLVATAGALLAAAALVALSTPGSLWKPEPAKLYAWLGILGGSIVAAALALWLKRRSLSRTASDWDREIHAKNRLEAAAEMAAEESPLARAQREESGQYLARAGGLRRPWLVPALAAVVAFLGLAQFLLVGVWVVEIAWHGWPAAKEVAEEKPPQARFSWVKPRSEIKASPLEEVPLTAQASSTSGLEKVSLEISVNGAAKKLSVPVDKKSLSQPGENQLDLSVYLDELEAEPFDVISYHLRGERITKASLPAVASDLQFIQVRPLRDEAMEREGGDGKAKACFQLLLKLKIAQLGLLKGNHVLSTAELDRKNPAWTAENTHMADEQNALAAKTREAVDFLIENNAHPQVVEWVKQAAPEMDSAGRSMHAIKNPEAVPHQEKALSLITACEKLFVKLMVRKSPTGGKPGLKDPFEDEQKYQLTKRAETAAGVLEQLAREQSELNEQMTAEAQKAGSSSEGGQTQKQAEQEKQIAAKLGSLCASLPGAAREAVQAAHGKAGEAAGHLENRDPQAGVQAGTEALARMQQALAGMRADGEASAAEKLAGVQKDLNDAAAQAAEAEKGKAPKAAEAAKALADAREALKAEAERQQREGSSEAAQRMADLVNRLNGQGLGKQLKSLAEGGKPETGQDAASAKIANLAREAGKGSLANLAAAEARKKTAGELARSAKMLQRLAQPNAPATAEGQGNSPGKGKGEGTADGKSETQTGSVASDSAQEVLEHLKAQVQNAESILQIPEQREAARKILQNIPDQAPQANPTSVVVFYQTQRMAIEELIGELQTAPASEIRANTFTVVRETEVPEAYREPVSRYFEELSRKVAPSGEATP